MLGTFESKDWVENFRMKKETFDSLCDKLWPAIFRQNTRFRKAICVEQLPSLCGVLLPHANIVLLLIYLE